MATRAAGRKTLDDEVRDLATVLDALGYPPPATEVRFYPVRRWRFDWAWPAQLIAVEFEGATFTGGRHTRGAGFEGDCRKYSSAAIVGWRVLRFTRAMVASGEALEMIRMTLDRPATQIPAQESSGVSP